jgi:hypothetical protein
MTKPLKDGPAPSITSLVFEGEVENHPHNQREKFTYPCDLHKVQATDSFRI